MSGLFNGVIIRLTLRATHEPQARAAVRPAWPSILIGISALLKATARATAWPPVVLGTFGYLVLALTALIVGGSVLGAEIEDGSIVHLLATPVSRRSVVLSKYLLAVALTVVFAAVPEYLAGAIATGPGSKLAIGLFVGALAGSVIYNALFLMLTAAFSPGRALAFGLLYVLLWEGLLANLVPGVGLLSAGHYSLAVANSIAHNSDAAREPDAGTAVGLGLVVTVAALVVAVQRLSGLLAQGRRGLIAAPPPRPSGACWRPAEGRPVAGDDLGRHGQDPGPAGGSTAGSGANGSSAGPSAAHQAWVHACTPSGVAASVVMSSRVWPGVAISLTDGLS